MLASVSQIHSQRRTSKRLKPRQAITPKPGISILSPRERQVIEYRSMGIPYKLLGPKLGISIDTAKRHASNAFGKLGVNSSLEAVRFL